MDRYIKKLIAGIFFLLALLVGGNSFADLLPEPEPLITAQPVSSLILNSTDVPPTIDITITGNDASSDVEFFLKENNSEDLTKIGQAPLSNSTISINAEYLTFQYPYAYNANNTELESIVVKTTSASGQQSGILQTFSFANLLPEPEPLVTIDFPGWASSENLPGWEVGNYCKKANSSDYYPCVQTDGILTRTPSTAPLYLILVDYLSNETAVLKTYPGGPSSFEISALTPEEAISYGGLLPGRNYTIYLSDDEEGNNHVDFGLSTTTHLTLGEVPMAIADTPINITSTEIKEVNGKRYFEISGVVNETLPNSMVNIALREVNNVSGGELIAQIPYNEGSTFTVPTAQTLAGLTSLEDGTYNLIFSRTGSGGTIQIQEPYLLPTVGNETIGEDPETGGVGAITPYISPEGQEIIDNGIVPTNCGKTINGEHKLCGFPQLIELIDRAIKFIFVLMLPITAIVFAYAGYLYLTSGGSSTKRDAAKKAMTNVIIGIIIVLAAFLVVRTILLALGVDTSQDWVFLNI